jgi:hypothetical protein
LKELDGLWFDIVKTKVGELIGYLTEYMLTRPCCSGEIVTVFKVGRVKVTRIECRNFAPPAGSRLADLSNSLELSSCALEAYGIADEGVVWAYGKLMEEATPH